MQTENQTSRPTGKPCSFCGKSLSEDLLLVLSQRSNEAEMCSDCEAIVRKQRFLAAWKRGIKLIGENYFNIVGNFDDATDKNQLCPNYEIIDNSLHAISKGQATFLAAMYSFYNSEDGQRLLESLERPNICDIAARLDDEYAAVIAELFLTYSGW